MFGSGPLSQRRPAKGYDEGVASCHAQRRNGLVSGGGVVVAAVGAIEHLDSGCGVGKAVPQGARRDAQVSRLVVRESDEPVPLLLGAEGLLSPSHGVWRWILTGGVKASGTA